MNLDIDFSVSNKGYYRSVHRDRETRVINFLIYLNSLSSKDGGALRYIRRKKYIKMPISTQDFHLIKMFN